MQATEREREREREKKNAGSFLGLSGKGKCWIKKSDGR